MFFSEFRAFAIVICINFLTILFFVVLLFFMYLSFLNLCLYVVLFPWLAIWLLTWHINKKNWIELNNDNTVNFPSFYGIWKPAFSYVCVSTASFRYQRPKICFQINSEETTWLKFVRHEECEYVANFMLELGFGRYMWSVPKLSVLIFYLNVCWTHLKLQVIPFKVWPLGSYTVVPTFFPLIIAVLEVIFRKCVYLIGYNFLYVFHLPEKMTLQLRFQLREEVEIAWS